MRQVVVGSENPVKLNTTKEAFAAMFPDEEFTFHTCSAPSGVSEQPFGSTETKLGASNRAHGCREAFPDADFYVGLEGGIEEDNGEYWAFAWMCVVDQTGKTGFGRASAYQLPPAMVDRIQAGMELGHAADVVFFDENSKQKGGTIAYLTNGAVNRSDFYRDAMIFALIPFVRSDLY